MNDTKFFNSIRSSLFNGRLKQSQVNGINIIKDTCQTAKLTLHQTAYVLATVYWETARTFQPIEEYGGKHRRYAPWYGRGYVQLTWERNYKKQQVKLKRMGVYPYQVHDNKKLALFPYTSAIICVYGMKDGDFTGKRLHHYINTRRVNYTQARRIVNGMDKARAIARIAQRFERGLI